MKEKRYTATLSVYVYANSDDHARSKVKMIENREREKYPVQDCRIVELAETPFASFVNRQVPLNKEYENLTDDLPF